MCVFLVDQKRGGGGGGKTRELGTFGEIVGAFAVRPIALLPPPTC